MKTSLRYIFFNLINIIGLNWVFRNLNRGRKIIICYHSVLPDDLITDLPIDGVSLCESSFKSQLDFISSKFRFGVDIYNHAEITLTFDDCRSNQQSIASKILDDRGINGIFFFPILNNEAKDPTIPIDDIILWFSFAPAGEYRIEIQASSQSIHIYLGNAKSRHEAWSQFYTSYGNQLWSVAEELIDRLDAIYPFSLLREKIGERYFRHRMMPITPTGIESMKSRGHQVGSHAYSHHPLSSLPERLLEDELRRCRAEIGRTFNTNIFCYPFGGLKEVSKRETTMVQNFGFGCGLSNMNEPIEESSDIYYGKFFIPRMMMPNTSSSAEISFILSGTKYFLKHLRLLPAFK